MTNFKRKKFVSHFTTDYILTQALYPVGGYEILSTPPTTTPSPCTAAPRQVKKHQQRVETVLESVGVRHQLVDVIV